MRRFTATNSAAPPRSAQQNIGSMVTNSAFGSNNLGEHNENGDIGGARNWVHGT